MGGQCGNCLVHQMCWLAASAKIMHSYNMVIMFNHLVIIIIIIVNDIWLRNRNCDIHTWVRLLSDPSFEANQRTWKLVMLSLCWWCCFCGCCRVIFVPLLPCWPWGCCCCHSGDEVEERILSNGDCEGEDQFCIERSRWTFDKFNLKPSVGWSTCSTRWKVKLQAFRQSW